VGELAAAVFGCFSLGVVACPSSSHILSAPLPSLTSTDLHTNPPHQHKPNPTQVLAQLLNTADLRSEEAKQAIIGACRDLRGVTAATQNRKAYCALFELLYPQVGCVALGWKVGWLSSVWVAALPSQTSASGKRVESSLTHRRPSIHVIQSP
jgi:hypothetical protein